MAEHVGMDRSFISDLENDKKSPSSDTLGRYSQLYDIPVSSIMLLAESEAGKPSSLKSAARTAISKRILRILEWMGSEERPKSADGAKVGNRSKAKVD